MVLRAKPDKKEEKDRVREELLHAALRLGAAHGFASLGLREVARAAAIAPTSFYRHFVDMEALGLSLIHDKVEPLLLEWASALERTENEPGELVDTLFRSVDRDPELVRFLVAERVGSSAVLRAALREALGVLAEPTDLVTVLVLDAAAELLDCTAEARTGLRQRTVQRLTSAMPTARNQSRKP